MKQKLLIIAFALPLILINPMFAQSKDAVKAIMTNQWVKKYKKLKTDLEDKAGFVKSMENISESDQEALKSSYLITSKMLYNWLDHLVNSIDENNQTSLTQISEGDLDNRLKEELLDIYTFYANDFSTKYEEITGLKAKAVVANVNQMESSLEESVTARLITSKVEKDYLISNVKKPLEPANWNSLF